MKKNGYTLIEVLAAVTILFTVIASLVAFFTGAVRVQREILSSQELVDNISYSLEYMSRALRMAVKDDVGGKNCLDGNKVNYELTTRDGVVVGIKFRNYKNYCQEFFLEGGQLKEWKDVDGVISTNDLTSENIEVSDFIIGSSDSWDQDDDLQPKVTLFIEARGVLSERSVIKIQTTISQRNLDVRY